jgi:valyl-tRNA synthetase
MQTMADSALAAVRSGRTTIIPAEWTKTYDHFLENIQDWCVSRQLWWGHQIPAWHGPNGEIKVARERPPECGPDETGSPWVRDPDVLDAWFSSALWPFSTLGWPRETPALAKFYPTNPKQTSDLETGYDILFFWVARMMMFGLHFMGEVPFRRILLSGLIVDETGEKMSKVKGNVIDPLDLVSGTTFAEMVKSTLPGAPEAEALAKFKKAYPSAAAMGSGFPAFGADAVRFTLATYPPSNKRIALAPKRIEGNRHFLNKIWNATRLALELLGDFAPEDESPVPNHDDNRWILSRFANAAKVANEGLAAFRIDEAANALYRFFWNELCDWYLEVVKPILRTQTDGAHARPELVEETRATLAFVLEGSLRLMHPLMPFITEELWQRVPKPKSSKVSVAFGPFPDERDVRLTTGTRAHVERDIAVVQSVVSGIRAVRSEHEVHPAARVRVTIRADNPDALGVLRAHVATISSFIKSQGEPELSIWHGGGGPEGSREPGTAESVVPTQMGTIHALVVLKGLVDASTERARVDRELKKAQKELSAIDKKLASPGFVERAPKEVVEESQAQRLTLVRTIERLEAAKKLADEL